jgi:tetratricopeptide (TPR) repeat protein
MAKAKKRAPSASIDALVEQNLPAAMTNYQNSLTIRDRLAKADPSNAGWQRDLSVIYDNVGDVQMKEGKLAEALTSFENSLAIRDRLTKSDPANAGWQHDLVISHAKVGSLLAEQGETALALKTFRQGREIVASLKEKSPDSARPSKELAWFDGEIARLQKATATRW